jgi:hypothetical protein
VLLDLDPVRASAPLSSQVRSTFYCRRAAFGEIWLKSQG